jgi:hypothetical protein
MVIAFVGTQLASIIIEFEGEAVVSEYHAVFYGNGILEETFTYKINTEGKRFLFRYWEVPLINDVVDYAHVELLDIDVPAGTYWYMVDVNGFTSAPESIDSNSYSIIMRDAFRNEVGAFNPNTYELGEYTVKYTFKVWPTIEYDDDYAHLNLKLASDHIPYQNVKVEIENSGYIETVYAHPPTIKQSIDKNMIIFSGRSAEDELLEFEFLMSPEALDQIDGFPLIESEVKKQTIDANRAYQFEYFVATGFIWFG